MFTKPPRLCLITAVIASCAFSSINAGSRCAMDVGGLGNYYVCKSKVWCNVSAEKCHRYTGDPASLAMIAESDSNQCTSASYVTDDDIHIHHTTLTAPTLFTATYDSPACFAKAGIGFWTALPY